MVRKQDQIYGCLLGAAAGDALGFCVEDLTLADIREKYGPGGIQGYDTVNGFATISSHTQLSMFTANGLLFGATRGATRGVMAPYVQYLGKALPSAVFAMLIVYCLKNVDPMTGTHGLPELFSILLVIGLHIWKRQMLLSIAGGTVCYMLLIQFVFV